MQMVRRLILAAALMAGLVPVMAQSPTPVPALPDTERRTSYSINASTCACSVGFALYGDSTDYQNWIEVWLNGSLVTNYTVTSPTGPLATIPRPITDAIVTFSTPQTGTVQIVGARRPRRVSQFNENTGVSARNLNQVITDIVAMLREVWDKINDVTGRVVMAPPGETMTVLPSASTRENMGLCFDNNGNPTVCVAAPGTTTISAGTGIKFTGTNPTTIAINQALYGLYIPGSATPSTVTGATATYTSAQNTLLLERSNSGSPMSDTLPGTSPGVLPAGAIITITNADTAGILSIKVGSGAALKTPAASTGYVYVCPGQTAQFYSDGANYWQIGGVIHCRLQANTTLQVATTGASTNDGLTASTPLATLQSAWALAQQVLDLNGFTLTIQLANGTYSGQSAIAGPITGQSFIYNGATAAADSNILIQGNTGTPDNVVLTSTAGPGTVIVTAGASFALQGMKIVNTNSGNGLNVISSNVAFTGIDWGTANIQFISNFGAVVLYYAPYTISGSAGCHYIAGQGGNIQSLGSPGTITVTGTPAFATAFACAQSGYESEGVSNTYSGSATGARYAVSLNGVINTGKASSCGSGTYYPGGTSGSCSTGGEYQ